MPQSPTPRFSTLPVLASGGSAPVLPALVPGDTLYGAQWHLGRLGDLQRIWDEYAGAGVHVGIYDDGVQYTHPDLAANYDASLHVSVKNAILDSYPGVGAFDRLDPHGTSVAGLIASAENGTGTVGVAYEAWITGVRIFGGPADINAVDRSGFLEAVAQSSSFDVINHSWGRTPGFYQDLQAADTQVLDSWFTSLEAGRHGLGTIHVKAAGNSNLNSNGDALGATRATVVVGAYDSTGSASDYSNSGSNLLVSAPSSGGGVGVVTTDALGDDGYGGLPNTSYTNQFGGTSAATPIVSGVVALMLDANQNLGWRDVQTILAYSAHEIGSGVHGTPASTEENVWLYNHADNWNGGGLHFSDDYGFGGVNAYNAVRMAEIWHLFDAPHVSANESAFSQSTTESVTLGDVALTEIGFTFGGPEFDVEHVDLTLNVAHEFLPDLQISLISPAGTAILVADLKQSEVAPLEGDPTSFEQWTATFGVQAFRGEDGTGQWTLRIDDMFGDFSGTLTSATITLHGRDSAGGVADVSKDVYHYTDEVFTSIGRDSSRQTLTDTDGGVDWVDIAAMTGDVIIDLAQGATSVADGQAFLTIAAGSDIENAVSGDGDDTLRGNGLANELHGMRGNDALLGGVGDDTLSGGAGNDMLTGGAGMDTFLFDRVFGNDNVDHIVDFSHADDTIALDITCLTGVALGHLSASAFFIVGSGALAADDRIIYDSATGALLFDADGSGVGAGIAFAILDTRPSDISFDDFVVVDDAAAQITQAQDRIQDNAPTTVTAIGAPISGSGLILGTERQDLIDGSDGNDEIRGLGGDDLIRAGAGDDVVFGGEGRDNLIGGEGNDALYAGPGEGGQFARGDEGDDVISFVGSGDSNVARGGSGNDTITGGASFDQLFGNEGDDVLYGGVGTGDFLDGGEGNDEYHVATDSLFSVIRENSSGSGNDRVFGSDGSDAIEIGDGDDYVESGRGDDEIFGDFGSDTIAAGQGMNRVIEYFGEGDLDTLILDGTSTDYRVFFGSGLLFSDGGRVLNDRDLRFNNKDSNVVDSTDVFATDDVMAPEQTTFEIYKFSDGVEIDARLTPLWSAIDGGGGAVSISASDFQHVVYIQNAAGAAVGDARGQDMLDQVTLRDSMGPATISSDVLARLCLSNSQGSVDVTASDTHLAIYAEAHRLNVNEAIRADAATSIELHFENASSNGFDSSGVNGYNVSFASAETVRLFDSAGSGAIRWNVASARTIELQVDRAEIKTALDDSILATAGGSADYVFSSRNSIGSESVQFGNLGHVNASNDGTSGDDALINAGAGLRGQIDLGAGDDEARVLGSGAFRGGSVDGGEGTDTLRLTFAVAGAIGDISDHIANFEILRLDAPVLRSTVDLHHFDDLARVLIAGGDTDTGSNTLRHLADGATVVLDASLAGSHFGRIAIDLDATSRTDVLHLVFTGAADPDTGAPASTATGIVQALDAETVHLDTGASPAGSLALALDLDVAQSLLLSGGAGIDLNAPGSDIRALRLLDASGVWGTGAAGGVSATATASGVAFTGGAGDDRLTGAAGADVLRGGDGADVLVGGAGDDTLEGGSHDDVLEGGRGDDTLDGGDSDDVLRGDLGDDALDGAQGDDILEGSTGNDHLVGGRGEDCLDGGSGNDRLEGGASADALSGGSGNDALDGGTGTDILFGDAGNDLLDGGNQNDDLHGGDGDDTLAGGADDDVLHGDEGDDVLRGDAGDDALAGGGGIDRLFGGAGADRFVFEALDDSGPRAEGLDRVEDFQQGLDRFDLSALDGDSRTHADDAFVLVDAFSGHGRDAGEIRVSFLGADTLVEADVNGDADADLAFLVTGHQQLHQEDFLI